MTHTAQCPKITLNLWEPIHKRQEVTVNSDSMTTPTTTPDSNQEPTVGDPLARVMKKWGATIHARSARIRAEAPEDGTLPLFPPENAQEAPPEPPERAKVITLPPWANDKRAAPNAVFRSALFPALNNKLGRKFLKEQKLYAMGGVEVRFTGEQFDQSDLDVYLEILNFAKGIPLGQPIKFSAYAMLKALGWATGGKDHKRLHSHLTRLCGGVVDVTDHKARYFGQLLFGGIRDEISLNYEITLNPNYAVLFGFGLWSVIDREQRRALERNSTAKVLHAYYSTHTGPSLHRYETLAGVAGLEGKNKTAVKNSLIRAHEEIKRIGFLLNYEVKATGIEVKATMTPGQQQHTLKKLAKSLRKLPV